MKNIVIFGAGGLAREIAWLIRDINEEGNVWNLLGFIERDISSVGKDCGGGEVIGTEMFVHEYDDGELNVVIGVGNPQRIESIRKSVESDSHVVFPNIIHPSFIGDVARIKLGKGNIICAGNVFTTDITIGSFNIMNLSCTYGHDVYIGDCCVINPGSNISGNVSIGDMCLLGAGCTILEGRSVASRATVGAGAVVTNDVRAEQIVVGVPARPLVR